VSSSSGLVTVWMRNCTSLLRPAIPRSTRRLHV
jgi:hypothetical protein